MKIKNNFLYRISRSLGAANDLDLLQKVLDFAMSVSSKPKVFYPESFRTLN